ncbi:MAG: hypothetical protein LBK13_05720 [Spirochaetales bacterium]|jgi:hypothetical protein|nr:hypothetical protein [Spirochaetales bacterium]
MKKKILCGGILPALLFSSCLGAPMVWDATLPEEEMATVVFAGLIASSYNGITVDWSNFGLYMKLPAGQSDFVFKTAWNTFVTYTGNIEWSYNFATGKRYSLHFAVSKGLPGVEVYLSPEGGERTLIEFVPFTTLDLSK